MEAKQLTVDDLDQFVKSINDKRLDEAARDTELKALRAEIDRLEAKAVMLLKELGRKNYQSPFGTISVVEKWRVSIPKTDEQKTLFFNHLRERGIYEKYVTVNSNSLQSLFLTDWDEAKKEGRGMEFVMPGIEAPKLHESLRFARAK